MNGETEKSNLGGVSLWASILGIFVPILIALLVRLLVKTNDEPYYMLCFLLFAGAELIALITGIIGRKSPAGRAGMGISIVCIVLTALAIPWFMIGSIQHGSVQIKSEQFQSEAAR